MQGKTGQEKGGVRRKKKAVVVKWNFTLMLRVVEKTQMTLELASSKARSSRISSRV